MHFEPMSFGAVSWQYTRKKYMNSSEDIMRGPGLRRRSGSRVQVASEAAEHAYSTGVIAIGVMLTQMHVPRKTPMDGKPGLESGATGIPWFVKAFAVLVSPQVRGPVHYLCIC